MPPAPKTTFVSLFAAESEAPLPSGDAAISAALDAYGAKYSKATSKRAKDIREELLAGLSWLHLNHEDVPSALRRIAEPHQQLLASALDLDYDAHSGKKQWQTILSRAIVARAVPGDTPVKRKTRSKKSNPSSSRAEKPGIQSSVELEDDDVEQIHASDDEEDPWSSAPFSPAQEPGQGRQVGQGRQEAICVRRLGL